MSTLFKIVAEVKINANGKRTWPTKTGYRPGFNFVLNKQTSGSIDLLDRSDLRLGEQAFVEINFMSDELLGDIRPGIEFKFYEGPNEIGQGKVIRVIGWYER